MNDQAFALRDKIAQRAKEEATKPRMRVFTVTSGKGGVGKSNFSTNLALCLSKSGKKPLILDADFGLANVEVILGERPKFHLAHYLGGQCAMDQLICRSRYGVPFISGGSGVKEMLFLRPGQVDRVVSGLKGLEEHADTLIIDTGAGINEIVLKFCEIADEVLVIVTPEPSSITDAYALIKTLAKALGEMPVFKVIINKAESLKEAESVYHKMSHVAKQFLGLELVYGGYIPYDHSVFEAVKLQKPIVNYNAKAKASQAYDAIGKRLVKGSELATSRRSWLEKFRKAFSPR